VADAAATADAQPDEEHDDGADDPGRLEEAVLAVVVEVR
jgi:hypothetical protein